MSTQEAASASLQTSGESEEEPEEVDPLEVLRERGEVVLRSAPHASFFHTVSMLERLTSDADRVGGGGSPRDERIRFRHDFDLSFSAGDVSKAEVLAFPQGPERSLEEAVPHYQLTTTFLGLTGTISPLPLYFAEEVLFEDDAQPSRRDFLDIFHHRVISLFYRAVSKYMPAREHLSSRTDDWMRRALYLTGLDPEVQTRKLDVQASVLLRLAPLLAGRGSGPRVMALAVREALREELAPDGEVRIRQFAGGWIDVDADQQSSLGTNNNCLGINMILGSRAYDQSGRYAIEIGPLHQHNYRRFLRDGDLLPTVKRVAELCCREPLDFDVELFLAPDAVPSFKLSSKPGQGAVIGRDARLRCGKGEAEMLKITDVGRMRFESDDEARGPAYVSREA